MISIVCDGGGSYGFGNLRRSATLAVAFKQRGYAVRLEAVSPEAKELLPPSPADVGGADLWLLDLPYAADAWVKSARANDIPVAALDFAGTVAPDLIISVFQRGTSPVNARHLVGFKYAIIRPDIAALAPAPEGHGAIVVIGGGDQHGLGERAACLLHSQGCDVTVVEGPLTKSDGAFSPDIIRLPDPPDLAMHMASSGWGVTGGGGTMLEMLCLGKAVHVIPRTPFEQALAQLVLDQGALLGIGLDSLRVPAGAKRYEIGAKAKMLIDGKGVDRILDAVGALL